MLQRQQRIKREILDDIEKGIVPANIASFEALHDYVDANVYGGVADLVGGGVWSVDDANKLQSAIDGWIQAGMPVS